MKKKLLSLLLVLTMVLSLAPAVAITASADTVDYTLVLQGGSGYKNSVADANALTVNELSALGITGSDSAEDGYTYAFNNVNFSTTAARAIQFTDSGSITLAVSGSNTVTGGGSSSTESYGVEFKNPLQMCWLLAPARRTRSP